MDFNWKKLLFRKLYRFIFWTKFWKQFFSNFGYHSGNWTQVELADFEFFGNLVRVFSGFGLSFEFFWVWVFSKCPKISPENYISKENKKNKREMQMPRNIHIETTRKSIVLNNVCTKSKGCNLKILESITIMKPLAGHLQILKYCKYLKLCSSTKWKKKKTVKAAKFWPEIVT